MVEGGANESSERGIIASLVIPGPNKGGLPRSTPRALSKGEEEEKEDLLHSVGCSLFYSELRVVPEDHGIICTEHVLCEQNKREKTTRWLFDDHSFRRVMFVPQELLALVAAGRDSGVVINMGHSNISIVPIMNMGILRSKAVILPMGGRDVVHAMQLFLVNRRSNQLFRNNARDFDDQVVEEIVKKHAYVVGNYDLGMRKAFTEKEHELPDGQVVKMGRELFQCTEILFQPSLFGLKDTLGLGEAVNRVITSCVDDTLLNPNHCKATTSQIILTGAGSMFPGLQDRLHGEVELPEKKVYASPERKLSAWIGGSIWASLSRARNCWTTKEEYDEYGPGVVHSKCW